MNKISFLMIAFLVIVKLSVGQIYTWSGSVSTDYQDGANWTPTRTTPSVSDTLSFNATAPVSVVNVPNQTAGAIQIAAGTSSVTLSSNLPTNILTLSAAVPLIYNSAGRILSGHFLTIQLGASSSFTISSGVFGIAAGQGGKVRINGALILAGGTLDIDVAGTGGTIINGPGGSITYNSGIFLCARTSSITWTAGSNYYHGINGSSPSSIPASIWQSGSTCNITGMNGGTIAPTGFAAINFANFTWNCPLQSGNIDLFPSGEIVNILGALSITSTGGGTSELRISSGKATVRAGGYLQTGGRVTLETGADTTTLRVSGDFTHIGGILNGLGGSSAGMAIIDLKRNVTRGASATWRSTSSSPASQLIFQFSGTTVQTVNVTAGTWNPPTAGRCNIVNINTDMTNGINLTGILSVSNTNSSVLPATLTMSGIITGSGEVNYTGPGAGGTTLIYNGSFFQIASNIEFPAANGPLHLTINNSLGVSFPAGFNRSLGGRLSMLSGNLAVGAGDTLSLTNLTMANQLSYIGGFITTGTLGRYFPTTGLPVVPGTNSLFPFGSGANARFLNVFFSSATLSGGTPGMIYVSHSPKVDATPISLADNNPIPITLDKRTNTSWNISTGAFNLGGGGRTASLTAVGANVGSVNDYTYLRLTDAVTPNFGTLRTTTGSNAVPTVGKTMLSQGDLNKTLYIGSDNHNPLIVITFTWTGLGGNIDWITPGNWTGGLGYPSSSTEIAIINSTSGTQPTINTGTSINVYRLTVGTGMTLTMLGTGGLNVFDNVSFPGTAAFAATSTFGYASSEEAQNIQNLPYGSLSLSGTAPKILPAVVTVTGNYNVSGPSPNLGNNTFIYAGAGSQRIATAKYYNLRITGNRGGGIITLGNPPVPGTIDIANSFDVSGLSNYNYPVGFNPLSATAVDFSSAGSQYIPGFRYPASILNSGNGPRILDSLGTTNSNHVISCRVFTRGSGAFTIKNSKVNFYVSGLLNVTYFFGNAPYYDLEISGDLQNRTLDFGAGSIFIANNFSVKLTNYKQAVNTITTFVFNGSGDQTIPAFRTDLATNSPAFKFSNVSITGGNRNVTLGGGGIDTIAITGNLSPEMNTATGVASPFAAGKGFMVTGSTVDFGGAGTAIPVLKPVAAGGNNYNNIVVSSGNRIINGNLQIGGNLTVSGTDPSFATTLTVGNGTNTMGVNILGNLTVTGNAKIPQ